MHLGEEYRVSKDLRDRRGAEEIDDFSRILYGFYAKFYCRRVDTFVCDEVVDLIRVEWEC